MIRIYGELYIINGKKTNLDWSNPETEVMFLKNHYKEMNKIYGPKGPNAFQRKLSQLADSKYVDTITNTKKESLLDIHKPPSQVIVDGEGFKKSLSRSYCRKLRRSCCHKS